ncbi:hypothetical protein RRG08_048733 [Elysia crispata]|uniref:Uncharacterized protein n=1 Tax=Elysia crispata TaxID=231223 RepID=A0AAE1D7V7_9GAST|nr:hypothetical protein RRG08_048733 [Elysia crispata]
MTSLVPTYCLDFPPGMNFTYIGIFVLGGAGSNLEDDPPQLLTGLCRVQQAELCVARKCGTEMWDGDVGRR